jgi:hypothetical protein
LGYKQQRIVLALNLLSRSAGDCRNSIEAAASAPLTESLETAGSLVK